MDAFFLDELLPVARANQARLAPSSPSVTAACDAMTRDWIDTSARTLATDPPAELALVQEIETEDHPFVVMYSLIEPDVATMRQLLGARARVTKFIVGVRHPTT